MSETWFDSIVIEPVPMAKVRCTLCGYQSEPLEKFLAPLRAALHTEQCPLWVSGDD